MKKKRTLSPEHLAKLQAGRAKAQAAKNEPVLVEETTVTVNVPISDDKVEEIAPDQDTNELKAQIKELQDNQALFKAAFLAKERASQSVGVGEGGSLVGEVERYLIDKVNYPDPTPRLAAEPKLVSSINFPFNYELNYKVEVSSYQTASGVRMKEPRFMVQLNRIVIDEQGEQTDKRWVVKRVLFHEDPEAAMVIARDNGIEIDKSDEKTFLNEMRYLRVRDWLFDIFWPKGTATAEQIQEEVIGGTLVQVFTKSSVEPSEVPFEKLNTKVVI